MMYMMSLSTWTQVICHGTFDHRLLSQSLLNMQTSGFPLWTRDLFWNFLHGLDPSPAALANHRSRGSGLWIQTHRKPGVLSPGLEAQLNFQFLSCDHRNSLEACL